MSIPNELMNQYLIFNPEGIPAVPPISRFPFCGIIALFSDAPDIDKSDANRKIEIMNRFFFKEYTRLFNIYYFK